MNSNLIALDADGVLLDYNLAYAGAWERACGVRPVEVNPNAYWAMDRFDVPWLEGAELAQFRFQFNEHFWSTVPALPGAIEACEALVEAGFELVCVSALADRYQAARLSNLRTLGFPVERVVTTGSKDTGRSPKAFALDELRPLAFVDDYLPYMRGIAQGVHKALVMRERSNSPNVGPELDEVHSQHDNLLAFAQWWTQTRPWMTERDRGTPSDPTGETS